LGRIYRVMHDTTVRDATTLTSEREPVKDASRLRASRDGGQRETARAGARERSGASSEARAQRSDRGGAQGSPAPPSPRLRRGPSGALRAEADVAKPPGLVAMLSHPNGWWRDTAQRLLIEDG